MVCLDALSGDDLLPCENLLAEVIVPLPNIDPSALWRDDVVVGL